MLSFLAVLGATGSTFFLKPNDLVVFYGDSITEQQVYTSLTEAFVRTRYPSLDVSFYGRGWSGDAAWGGGGGSSIQRIDRDVKPLHPSVVSVMLGMNDGGYVPFDPKIYKVFEEWYGKLLDQIRLDAPQARLTLIRTTPWDAITRDYPKSYPPGKWEPWSGYNDVLVRFGAVVRANARKFDAKFVDFNAPLVKALKAANPADRPVAQKIVPDGIHPGVAGGTVAAAELFRAWGGSPVVSDVCLDATAKRVVRSRNARVEDFDGLTWTQTDEALPFAVDPDDPAVQLVLITSNLLDRIDREMLTVRGLANGLYELRIDGTSSGSYSGAQLAQGINLAAIPTPMRAQSLKLLGLIREKCKADFDTWRASLDPRTFAPMSGGANLRDLPITPAQLKAASQPAPHRFELARGNP